MVNWLLWVRKAWAKKGKVFPDRQSISWPAEWMVTLRAGSRRRSSARKVRTLFREGFDRRLGPVTTHVLAQKVEAVLNVRDVGFLVGEFETPLL